MKFDNFLRQKRVTYDGKYVWFEWYLIHKDKRNGVHLHGIQDFEGQTGFENNFGFRTHGVEIHSKRPLYGPGQKPLPNCFVTQGDCYCDGSSSAARDEFGHINPVVGFDDFVWDRLMWFYQDNFQKEGE